MMSPLAQQADCEKECFIHNLKSASSLVFQRTRAQRTAPVAPSSYLGWCRGSRPVRFGGTRAQRTARGTEFLSWMVPRIAACALLRNSRTTDRAVAPSSYLDGAADRGLCAFEELAHNGPRPWHRKSRVP